jgi:hypothetical protein
MLHPPRNPQYRPLIARSPPRAEETRPGDALSRVLCLLDRVFCVAARDECSCEAGRAKWTWSLDIRERELAEDVVADESADGSIYVGRSGVPVRTNSRFPKVGWLMISAGSE